MDFSNPFQTWHIVIKSADIIESQPDKQKLLTIPQWENRIAFLNAASFDQYTTYLDTHTPRYT